MVLRCRARASSTSSITLMLFLAPMPSWVGFEAFWEGSDRLCAVGAIAGLRRDASDSASHVKAPLTTALLDRRAFEGVIAAGRQADGAVAKVHRLRNGDDLDARDRGETGKFELPGAGRLGHHRF